MNRRTINTQMMIMIDDDEQFQIETVHASHHPASLRRLGDYGAAIQVLSLIHISEPTRPY